MKQFLYCRPSENVAQYATVSAAAADPAYPPENLVDRVPSRPAKLTDKNGDFIFAYTGPQRIDVASIIHANFDTGLTVFLQGNATNAWGSPTFSCRFSIPQWQYGYPVNPWLDLTTQPGYNPMGFQYWRISIALNSVPISIGEVVLASRKRQLQYSVRWGSTRVLKFPTVIHETDMEVRLMYGYGIQHRRLDATCDLSSTGETDFLAWVRDARGPLLPFLIVPDTEENDAWFGAFDTQESSVNRVNLNHFERTFTIREVTRGLAP